MLTVNARIKDAKAKCGKWSRQIKVLVEKMTQIKTISKQTLVRQHDLKLRELSGEQSPVSRSFPPATLLVLTARLSFYPSAWSALVCGVEWQMERKTPCFLRLRE